MSAVSYMRRLQAFICSKSTVKQAVRQVAIAGDVSILRKSATAQDRRRGNLYVALIHWLLSSPKKKRIGQQVHIRCSGLSLAHDKAAKRASSRSLLRLTCIWPRKRSMTEYLHRLHSSHFDMHSFWWLIYPFMQRDIGLARFPLSYQIPWELSSRQCPVEVTSNLVPCSVQWGLRRLSKRLTRSGIR